MKPMIIAMPYDATKFSLVEIFLNNSGKTSSTKTIGLISSLVCMMLFIILVIFYMFNVKESAVILLFIDKIITIFGISAGLMGIKSISSSISHNKIDVEGQPMFPQDTTPKTKQRRKTVEPDSETVETDS